MAANRAGKAKTKRQSDSNRGQPNTGYATTPLQAHLHECPKGGAQRLQSHRSNMRAGKGLARSRRGRLDHPPQVSAENGSGAPFMTQQHQTAVLACRPGLPVEAPGLQGRG